MSLTFGGVFDHDTKNEQAIVLYNIITLPSFVLNDNDNVEIF